MERSPTHGIGVFDFVGRGDVLRIPARGAVIDAPLLAFSVGCVPVVHRNVPSFANAVTLATENSKSAFDAMEQQHEDVQAERTVISYEKHGSIQR